jgi:hypothetical protein
MVSLNRLRRTAEAKRLFLVETAPCVEGLRFENTEAIEGHIPGRAHAHLLLAGLNFLFAWGGATSRGLGWGEVVAQAWLNEKESIVLDVEEVRSLCRF